MKLAEELLRQYIERSGYTIYSIAKAADINRSTLQKALSGDRTLSIDILERLYPYLKLTQNERSELLKIIDIKQNGMQLHEQREFIRDMVEHISDMMYGNQVIVSDIRESYYLDKVEFENTQVFRGSSAVKNLLIFMVDFECTEKKPKVFTNIPGKKSIIHDVFEHKLYHSNNYTVLDIRHVVHFTKDYSQQKMCRDNLETFFNIVPLISIADFPYTVYYNYRDKEDLKDTAFPFYILGTNWCVLISEDCMTALYCNKKDVIEYLENIFETEWSNSIPLASLCQKPEDILPYLLKVNSTDAPHYCIEFQPCLMTYLTNEMIQKYSRKGIPNYEQNIQYLMARRDQMQGLSKHTCYFSKTGLFSFTETGYMVDFPQEYAYPIDKHDRKILLEAFYKEIEDDRQDHRVINPLVLLISDYFTYCVTEEKGLAFYGYNDKKRQYNYIIIEEFTMINALVDFSKYLLSSPYVYSKEETLAFLKQCIELCD